MGRIICRFCNQDIGGDLHLCEGKAKALSLMKKYDLSWDDVQGRL